jgi:hypothetical protein
MADCKMQESLRSASPEDLTRAALTYDAQVASLMEVNREGVERFSAPQAAASEAVIRTRDDLKDNFTALSAEFKTGSASLRRGPS